VKIGILGGSGLLGTEIRDYLKKNYNLNECYYESGIILRNENMQIVIPRRIECEVYNPDHLRIFLRNGYDIVIHAASYTQERFKKFGPIETHLINCLSPAMVCGEARDSKIIYISTDYVFDGSKGMYNETEVPNPLGFYAKTKWYAEGVFLSHGHKVIRTSFCPKIWPYEKAYEDKYASRDYVDVIAALIVKCCLLHNMWDGILHVGTQRKSFYELAKQSKPDVKPNQIQQGFDVPPDTSFDLTKMKGVLGNDCEF
jgi:dTDP-4-dehydrorhamnose reductase